MGDNENSIWIIRHSDVRTRNETSADFDAVQDRFKKLNPRLAQKAGAAYESAAIELAAKAKILSEKHAPALIEAWGGPAAQKALDQMKQIYSTAFALSDQSATAAKNFSWYGYRILPWYKDLGEKMSDGFIHTDGDDKQARMLMNRLNGRAADIQNNYPEQVTTNLPGPKFNASSPGAPNGPGGPGGPGGIPKANLPKGDPFGKMPDNKNPNLPGGGVNSPNLPGGGGLPGGGHGTNLAGFTPPGGGLSGGGLSGGGPGGGGLSGDPFGTVGGVGGSGGGAGITGTTGAGDLGVGTGIGSALGGRAGGGVGGGLMPMAGGGHNQGEKGRERSTWLAEDEDIWGGDEDAVPGQIG